MNRLHDMSLRSFLLEVTYDISSGCGITDLNIPAAMLQILIGVAFQLGRYGKFMNVALLILFYKKQFAINMFSVFRHWQLSFSTVRSICLLAIIYSCGRI